MRARVCINSYKDISVPTAQYQTTPTRYEREHSPFNDYYNIGECTNIGQRPIGCIVVVVIAITVIYAWPPICHWPNRIQYNSME